MPNIDWLSFVFGIGFAMFILPLISQILGRMKGKANMTVVQRLITERVK